MPSASLAMKPCVTTMGASRASRSLERRIGREAAGGVEHAGSGGGAARAPRPAAWCARRPSRPPDPGARRKRAPRSVARSSPLDMTRARVRSLTSPISAMPGGDLAQLRELALAVRPERDAELGGEPPVPLVDDARAPPPAPSPRAAASSFSRRSVMPVTAECTISTRAPSARRAAGDLGDVAPVGERGDAGAAEFEDDPVGRGAGHESIPQASGSEGGRRGAQAQK